MHYRFPELHQSHGHIMHRILATGTLSRCLMTIEVPDDFDWQGPAPKPADKPGIPPLTPALAATLKSEQPITLKSIHGFGDLFALIAQPIARLLDRVFTTKVTGCQSCARRRTNWNRWFPFRRQAAPSPQPRRKPSAPPPQLP